MPSLRPLFANAGCIDEPRRIPPKYRLKRAIENIKMWETPCLLQN